MQLDVESRCSLFEQLCLQSRTDPQCVSIIETHVTGTQVGDECETESVSPAFKPLACSPSIEVASGATRLAKLLPTFHKDSGYCQRTPSHAISLMSTLSLVRHSYPTALSYLNIHLTPRNLLRHLYVTPVPSLMPKCSRLSTETHLRKVISHGCPEPWQEAQHSKS